MNKARFFVVIHALTGHYGLSHAISQTKIAKDSGADGVLLIPDYEKGFEKKATSEDLVLFFKIIEQKVPGFPIGLNFLRKSGEVSKHVYATKPNFLQSDASSIEGIDLNKISSTELFCGVAFKYSRNENLSGEKLKEHCEKVSSICHVPTTSGTATGRSASTSKIKEVRSYLPVEKRLGIASGVDDKNIKTYLDLGVTDFLVATSLIDHVDENECDILDTKKVHNLSEIIHKH
ncbi:hypothetical protein IT402_02005 [Candidatus Nomurabacteria bacterium]|nr:hypothetical protein [Candidatus Nomurabacteria bacterium]